MHEGVVRRSPELFQHYDQNGISNKYNSSKGIDPDTPKPDNGTNKTVNTGKSPEKVEENEPEESLNEDQRIKKRQLQFIVDELDRLYQSHSSYQVFLKKAREELIVNKGNGIT